MLLSLFTLIIVLLSSLSLASFVDAWVRGLRKLVPSLLCLDRQFSFLSLIVFLFFPSTAANPSQPMVGDRSKQK